MPAQRERSPQGMLDFDSKVALKLVIEIMIIVVGIVSMWYNLRMEINNINNGLEKINVRLEDMETNRWDATSDFIFMERFSNAIKLEMPEHKGE